MLAVPTLRQSLLGPDRSPLSPAALPNQVCRFDFTAVFTDTAGTTPATGTDLVARINDVVGGYHATQGTSGNRPTLATLSGQPALLFDGTDDRLLFDALAALYTGSNPTFSVVGVVRPTSFAAARTWFSLCKSDASNPFMQGFFNTTPDVRFSRRSDAGTNVAIVGGRPVANEPLLVVLRTNGVWGDLWLNGQYLAGRDFSTANPATFNRAVLGALGANGFSQPFLGEIAAFTIVSGVLDSASIPRLAAWKHAVYGGA